MERRLLPKRLSSRPPGENLVKEVLPEPGASETEVHGIAAVAVLAPRAAPLREENAVLLVAVRGNEEQATDPKLPGLPVREVRVRNRPD